MSVPRRMQPLDRFALGTMLLVAGLVAVMLLMGAQARPAVRTFSWQDKPVSADDIAFSLTFSQPVEIQSVEQNLRIEPALVGKFSWAGRRMAYTLAVPAPYGETFRLSLPTAQALRGQNGFEPFASEFKTRDRAFVYIGTTGEEAGRLVLFNMTRKQSQVLTPEELKVLDFEPYPRRDRILFSALDMTKGEEESIPSAQLYTVTTGQGINEPPPAWKFWQPDPALEEAGQVKLILDNSSYQNLKFDLSPDGKVIVVQRVNQANPANFGPWVLREGDRPRKLRTEPGGDFTIAPDSLSLLLQQGEGTAVIALEPDLTAAEADELLDFLPDYGLTLDIANDGSAAALVNFNQDDPDKQFTQSLFWVSNRGEERPLLQTNGAILSAEFNDDNSLLYCVINKLVEGAKDYQVEPYLIAVNIETGETQELLEMPPQPDINVSLSPDGLAVLFDEARGTAPLAEKQGQSGTQAPAAQKKEASQETQSPSKPAEANTAEVNTAEVNTIYNLWLLPLYSNLEERLSGNPVALSPTNLEIAGKSPMWLP